MIRTIAALALATAGLPVAPAAASEPLVSQCSLDPADIAWTNASTAAWSYAQSHILGLKPTKPPTLVVFDKTCTYWPGPMDHGGQVILPDGNKVPAHVVSFAAPYNHDRDAFFVMALPSVWRAEGVKSDLGLETLMTAVRIHETTHTRQFYYFTPRMVELTARWKLPEDINDDALQGRFAKDEAYVAAYTAERDLLFAAAAEPDRAKARAMARQALAMVRARQDRFFTGEDAKWRDLDDAFLTLEGVAQFAAWRWLTDPKGAAVEPAKAMTSFRRGGRFWTQDEGLALFLTIDRLVPDWRARAFAKKPATAYELLALAAAG